MAVAHFDTSEVRSLAVDLSKAPLRVVRQVPVVVKKALHDIERDAKVLAPVDTGNLKNSISNEVDADKLGGIAGPTAEYGGWVEYGTEPHAIPNAFGLGPGFGTDPDFHPGTAPQPYMGPAFDRNAPKFAQALGKAGEDSVL